MVDIIDRYPAPYGNQEILVLSPFDWRVSAAIAIEKFNMMLLGDSEDLAEEDLNSNISNAMFLALYPSHETPSTGNMLGVVRVMKADPHNGRLCTIMEISKLTGIEYEDIYSMLSLQAGEPDPFKVFDIATFGMSSKLWDQRLVSQSLFDSAKYNLMFAMSREGIRAHQERGASVGLAYFNTSSRRCFVSKGYEWKTLAGIPPKRNVIMNRAGEKQEGQWVVPTFLDIASHLGRLRQGRTSHLADIASYMRSNSVRF